MYDHVGKTYQEQLKDQWSTCNPVEILRSTSLVEFLIGPWWDPHSVLPASYPTVFGKLMGRGIPSSEVLIKKNIAMKKIWYHFRNESWRQPIVVIGLFLTFSNPHLHLLRSFTASTRHPHGSPGYRGPPTCLHCDEVPAEAMKKKWQLWYFPVSNAIYGDYLWGSLRHCKLLGWWFMLE